MNPTKPLLVAWLACKIRGHRRGLIFSDTGLITSARSMCGRCGQMVDMTIHPFTNVVNGG